MQFPGDPVVTVLIASVNDAEAVYSRPGDFDFDGDTDLEDYDILEICLYLSRPEQEPPFQECLDSFDFDLLSASQLSSRPLSGRPSSSGSRRGWQTPEPTGSTSADHATRNDYSKSAR